MADRKQLKILKQGVEVWNAWREENPDAKIDLCGAELDGLVPYPSTPVIKNKKIKRRFLKDSQ